MKVETLENFWNKFDQYAVKATSGPPMMFRGVSDKTYKLIPSIARDTYDGTNNNINVLEEQLMREFKRLSVPVLTQYPKSDFEWQFLAQHYGLPTRLLDWSSNPLIALFFAVEKDDNKDGMLYIISHQVTDQYELFDYRTANEKSPSMFALQPNQGEVIFIRPKYTDQRYLNQKSIFSCPENPFKSFNLPTDKLIIKKEWKYEIRTKLDIFGITHSYVYPGLDGVAKEIKIKYYDPVQKGKVSHIVAENTIKLPT